MEPTDLSLLAQRFALQVVDTGSGRIGFRRAGPGKSHARTAGQTPLVLLHGIGSGSGSWVRQLEAFGDTREVLAWDAPGYGASTPVPAQRPQAQDYGARVWAWLDALGVGEPVTLVGHSLGAIMATSAAGLQPARVMRLVLLSPAGGYGLAAPEVREAKLRDRLHNLETLGPAGMAAKRGAAMLSAQTAQAAQADISSGGAPASPASGQGRALLAYVQATMAQVIPAGYTQATHLLADADLAGLLSAVKAPLVMASGAADTITPPAGCEALARGAHAPYVSLGPVGHVCALEGPDAVNALLQ
jgi:pimeloyl-ACP methyl ester carboxylesterase